MQSIITNRFRAIFLTLSGAMLMEYLAPVISNMIAGNLLGAESLAGIVLVTPFLNIIIFISYLISVGTSVMMVTKIGEQNLSEANNYFSQGLILDVLLGVVLTLIMLLFKEPILALFKVDLLVHQYASDYYTIIAFLPIFYLVEDFIYTVALNQGNQRNCLISSVVQLLTNIGLAFPFCQYWGIKGIGLALLISTILGLLISLNHFRSVYNTTKFHWCLKWSYIRQMVKYGITDSSNQLYIAVSLFVLNLFLLHYFGSSAVIVFAVVYSLMLLFIDAVDGAGGALQPFICVYKGENSLWGLKEVVKVANRFTLWESLAVMAVILFSAQWIPTWFGIEDPKLVADTIMAVRIYSLNAVFFSFNMLYMSYYVYTGAIKFSLLISTLSLCVAPLLLVPTFSFLGETGIWIGMALTGIFTALVSGLFIKYRESKKTFPLLLEQQQLEQQLRYDIALNNESIADLNQQIEQDLTSRGIELAKILKMQLMVEEIALISLERNQGRKNIRLECTIFLGEEEITVVLMDNGQIQNTLEEANSSPDLKLSFQIINAFKQKEYLNTIGFNKTVLKF